MCPLISVIVPVYKVELYIRKCIESILRQTYSNLEIILVDDGSPDRCPEICDEYAQKDCRIKVIHKQNGGLSDARNTGLDIARGEYIGFVDSDDYISEDMFETLYDMIANTGADISVCNFYYSYLDGRVEKCPRVKKQEVLSTKKALRQILLNKKIESFAWNKLYRAHLFSDIRYPVGKYFEDVFITFQLFAKAQKTALTNDAKYYYLQRPDSICGRTSLKKIIDRYEAEKLKFECFINRDALSADCGLSALALHVISGYSHLVKHNMMKSGAEWIREAKQYLNRYWVRLFVNIYLPFVYKGMILIWLIDEKLYLFLKPFMSRKKILYYKNYIMEFRKISKEYKGLLKRPCLFLIGTPQHGNLGDQLIAEAEHYFASEKMPNTMKEIPYETFPLHLNFLKKHKTEDDVFLLQGGGNMGIEYLWEEELRRQTIESFPNNRVIIFPQTIDYGDSEIGMAEFQNSQRIYASHPDLHICAREKYSYEIMKAAYSQNDVLLVPDMALLLNRCEPRIERKGILLCLRRDIERRITPEQLQEIYDFCRHFTERVTLTDTVMNIPISAAERNMRLKEKLEEFQRAELVITDRLHGMVFCAITGTPCIALDNYNYKVRGVYDWITDLEHIQFLYDYREIPDYIPKLLAMKECQYDEKRFEPYFAQIAALLRKQ